MRSIRDAQVPQDCVACHAEPDNVGVYTMHESTALLGAAIGKADLQYVQEDPQRGKAALIQHGFSESAAALMEEMNAAFSARRLNGEHETGPTEITPTTLEHFAATVFKAACESARRA